MNGDRRSSWRVLQAILVGHVNPTYVLYTVGDTASVRAAGAGTVLSILANPAPDTDSEIHILPSGGPDYLIIYDLVVSVQISVGQSVTAGQVLGRVAPWYRDWASPSSK